VSQLSLWFGMLGGAAAWAAHLVMAYSLVPLACAQGLEILLYATIPLTMIIALAAIFFAWRGWSQVRELEMETDGNGNRLVSQRVRFMALSGLAMSTLFLVVIIAQSVPILTQNPCDPAGSIRI
jgi:nicotinamide riboside transporter PnuC